jgi:hypothetical protein
LIRSAKIAVIEELGIERKGRLAAADAAGLRDALQTLMQPLLGALP